MGQKRGRYCSDACKRANKKQRDKARDTLRGGRQRNPLWKRKIAVSDGLPAGTVGAIGELMVCDSLMRRGVEVFRAASPSSSCDLMALWGGRAYRIEVKVVSRNSSGGWRQPDDLNPAAYDVLALVKADEGIEYRPNPWESQ